MKKINVLIVGAGHYTTGSTVLLGSKSTDKDYGVLLPSVLALRSRGLVGEVTVVGRSRAKLGAIADRMKKLSAQFGWNDKVTYLPDDDEFDDQAYVKAIQELSRPAAVLIAVPDNVHRDVMICCITNEVPFLVVKPAVTTLDDLYNLLDQLDANPVLAMVDYHKVYDDANIMIKEDYLNNTYGKLQHFSSLMTQRRDMLEIYRTSLLSDYPPNINHYLGSHYIHFVGFISGASPLDVRSIPQSGVAENMYKYSGVADLIATQVRWREPSGNIFTSYHISGWSDPSETESMTYQEIHMLCEKGHIDSDQRFRGLKTVLAGQGSRVPNPYFFNFNRGPSGSSLETKYGFLSVKYFLKACLDLMNGKLNLEEIDNRFPTLRESEAVTAILEAADLSIRGDSKIINIVRKNNRYYCLG